MNLNIRKRFLVRLLLIISTIVLSATACLVYARFIEPTWLRVEKLQLASSPTVRLIHITDIHFVGDTQYLEKVVATINEVEADLVCFTGDLVEEAAHVDGALTILSKLNKPVYGIAGNHDLWVLDSFESFDRAFRATGGRFLSDDLVLVPSLKLALMSPASQRENTPPGYRSILLEHYPDAVERIQDAHFDLILAGHTHGGQVRLPLVTTRILPFEIGRYDRGLFQTPSGPLYVNPGIGTFYLPIRFRCRPEITYIEM